MRVKRLPAGFVLPALSDRSVPGLGQGAQSGQLGCPAGAQRELE